MEYEQYLIYQNTIEKFTGREDIVGKFVSEIAAAPEQNVHNAKALLSELGSGCYVALCVKAEFALKNWHPERWADLIKKVNDTYNVKMFITGVAKDKDYAERIIKMSGINVANFCGRTSLLDLVALYEHSKMMITTDLGARRT